MTKKTVLKGKARKQELEKQLQNENWATFAGRFGKLELSIDAERKSEHHGMLSLMDAFASRTLNLGHARGYWFFFYTLLNCDDVKEAVIIDERVVVELMLESREVVFKSPDCHEPDRLWELRFHKPAEAQHFYHLLEHIASGDWQRENELKRAQEAKKHAEDLEKAKKRKDMEHEHANMQLKEEAAARRAAEGTQHEATGNQLYREYKGAAQTTVPSKSEAATGVEMHVAEPLAQVAIVPPSQQSSGGGGFLTILACGMCGSSE